jgi:hypothetical protein
MSQLGNGSPNHSSKEFKESSGKIGKNKGKMVWVPDRWVASLPSPDQYLVRSIGWD